MYAGAYCTVLYWSVLYITVLHCTVLRCVQEPYSVTLQLELDSLHSATVVRLLYERVPYHYDATVAILDTPVVEEVMPVTYDIIDVVLYTVHAYFYTSQRMTYRCKS